MFLPNGHETWKTVCVETPLQPFVFAQAASFHNWCCFIGSCARTKRSSWANRIADILKVRRTINLYSEFGAYHTNHSFAKFQPCQAIFWRLCQAVKNSNPSKRYHFCVRLETSFWGHGFSPSISRNGFTEFWSLEMMYFLPTKRGTN